ncbi:C2H2 transcription factor [Metarhizium robertsii ARSEF 23]|nr:C2H2 transcription factor [Metarhizium robertsii ARSEF 23]KHO10838.1 C2H2 transcription factor [Metarhizium robertsii ARSEF 23]
MGLHIGMPVTATNDTSTHLITNYNGIGKRNQDRDYQILQTGEDELVPLWKALRATTAAP